MGQLPEKVANSQLIDVSFEFLGEFTGTVKTLPIDKVIRGA